MSIQAILDEIWDELTLEGEELDQYLAEIGLDPQELIQDYSKAMEAAIKTVK